MNRAFGQIFEKLGTSKRPSRVGVFSNQYSDWYMRATQLSKKSNKSLKKRSWLTSASIWLRKATSLCDAKYSGTFCANVANRAKKWPSLCPTMPHSLRSRTNALELVLTEPTTKIGVLLSRSVMLRFAVSARRPACFHAIRAVDNNSRLRDRI